MLNPFSEQTTAMGGIMVYIGDANDPATILADSDVFYSTYCAAADGDETSPPGSRGSPRTSLHGAPRRIGTSGGSRPRWLRCTTWWCRSMRRVLNATWKG